MTERNYKLRLEAINSEHSKAIQKADAEHHRALEDLQDEWELSRAREQRRRANRLKEESGEIPSKVYSDGPRITVKEVVIKAVMFLPRDFTSDDVYNYIINSGLNVGQPLLKGSIRSTLNTLRKKRVVYVSREMTINKDNRHRYRHRLSA